MNVEIEKELVSKRNEVSFFHRNFIVVFLSIISTICLLAIPGIPNEWLKSAWILKWSFILLLIDIIIIPIYTLYRNNRDLNNLDYLLDMNNKGLTENITKSVLKKSKWNEYISESVVFIFTIAIILILLSLVLSVENIL